MIIYFDTSALVPLLIDEPTSEVCGELWDGADNVACTRLGYIEAVAAVAMAERIGRISEADATAGRGVLDELWPAFDVIELSGELMSEAARLAILHGLRGYDATHCAAAIAVNDVELVAASGDKRLLAAWRAEGVSVCDTSV
ncbi:PIN domain-containing protein [Flexivirga oryzae]|uniref:Ribonuclease VapC n=1 Tax=Flexivirga oryzae TaxID=1794944 RepID=A0A839N7T0_9MICO|nr:hypothetical protein [Flexivirga oryzae]